MLNMRQRYSVGCIIVQNMVVVKAFCPPEAEIFRKKQSMRDREKYLQINKKLCKIQKEIKQITSMCKIQYRFFFCPFEVTILFMINLKSQYYSSANRFK